MGLRWINATLLAALLAPFASPLDAAGSSSADALAAFRAATAHALQGDMPAALGGLATLAPAGLDAERRRIAVCMAERFRSTSPVPAAANGLDPWSASLLAAYREYWGRVL